MLFAESFADDQTPASDRLVLPYEARRKSRQRVTLLSGEELGYVLPSGTVLKQGDRLLTGNGLVIEVEAAPEVLLEVRTGDPCCSAVPLTTSAIGTCRYSSASAFYASSPITYWPKCWSVWVARSARSKLHLTPRAAPTAHTRMPMRVRTAIVRCLARMSPKPTIPATARTARQPKFMSSSENVANGLKIHLNSLIPCLRTASPAAARQPGAAGRRLHLFAGPRVGGRSGACTTRRMPLDWISRCSTPASARFEAPLTAGAAAGLGAPTRAKSRASTPISWPAASPPNCAPRPCRWAIRCAAAARAGRFSPCLPALSTRWPKLSFPVGWALAAVVWKITPVADSLTAWACGRWCENQVMAALKAVPLGQTAGQRLLMALGEVDPGTSSRARASTRSALEQFRPGPGARLLPARNAVFETLPIMKESVKESSPQDEPTSLPCASVSAARSAPARPR
jgi:urease accessory protein